MLDMLMIPFLAVAWLFRLFIYWHGDLGNVQHLEDSPEETTRYARAVLANVHAEISLTPDAEGVGSVFGSPGDKWTGGRMACAPHDYVNSIDHVCAHRWYPCGTILLVEYKKTNKRSWCVVADRGPYGANVFASDGARVVNENGSPAWYVKIRRADVPPREMCPDGLCAGKWRGVLDMSPAVSRDLLHPGMGQIKIWRLKRVVDYMRHISSHKPPSRRVT